jgi:hypothetical protein
MTDCDYGLVNRDEVDRLRKRFMKLDKVRPSSSFRDVADPYRTTLAPLNEMNF